MRYFFFFTSIIYINCFGQNLQVPPRNLIDPSGDEFVAIIENMSLTNRENAIYEAVLDGNIPDFMRSLKPITDSIFNGTNYIDILYYVIPDYLAIGSDSNYYLCPMTPILAQKLADTLNCILPTRKMVNKIWSTAPLHLSPQTIPPSAAMTTVPVMNNHNTMVWNQREPLLGTYPLGVLTGGNKKDVILSNYIYDYPPPDRVVIYGWHYTSGTPIQPMYAGHESTYADYSHGIRLVQNLVWVDGIATTATAVLTSLTLNSLLSNEGVINPPRYPTGTTVSLPSKPLSFVVFNESPTSIKVKMKADNNILFYNVYKSTDGINFTGPIISTSNEVVLTGLTQDIVYYIKYSVTNSVGESIFSEVLASTPSSNYSNLLIVNAYDRPKTSNTYDFIRYHAPSIFSYGLSFNSATNNALLDTLDFLQNYEIVDLLLGEESTANETFSSIEQINIIDYLDNGGKLFLSGAEIGWDLQHLGNANDSVFYTNYLKANYVYDAPNNQSGTYYGFKPIVNGIFNGIDTMQFDNGSNGIYNVLYPDAIEAINGSTNSFAYSNLTNNFAAVNYHGLFPNGIIPGKLVHFGFPFETIISAEDRDTVMNRILTYFTEIPSTTGIENELKHEIHIYPNPVTEKLTIKVNNIKNALVSIDLHNSIGELIYNVKTSTQYFSFDMACLSNGIYILSISKDHLIYKEKIIKY